MIVIRIRNFLVGIVVSAVAGYGAAVVPQLLLDKDAVWNWDLATVMAGASDRIHFLPSMTAMLMIGIVLGALFNRGELVVLLSVSLFPFWKIFLIKFDPTSQIALPLTIIMLFALAMPSVGGAMMGRGLSLIWKRSRVAVYV